MNPKFAELRSPLESFAERVLQVTESHYAVSGPHALDDLPLELLLDHFSARENIGTVAVEDDRFREPLSPLERADEVVLRRSRESVAKRPVTDGDDRVRVRLRDLLFGIRNAPERNELWKHSAPPHRLDFREQSLIVTPVAPICERIASVSPKAVS